jgi:hypothetical protein
LVWIVVWNKHISTEHKVYVYLKTSIIRLLTPYVVVEMYQYFRETCRLRCKKTISTLKTEAAGFSEVCLAILHSVPYYKKVTCSLWALNLYCHFDKIFVAYRVSNISGGLHSYEHVHYKLLLSEDHGRGDFKSCKNSWQYSEE